MKSDWLYVCTWLPIAQHLIITYYYGGPKPIHAILISARLSWRNYTPHFIMREHKRAQPHIVRRVERRNRHRDFSQSANEDNAGGAAAPDKMHYQPDSN
jgi:hypothetical protein